LLALGTVPGRSCGPVRFQVDHFGPFGFGVQVVGPPLKQVGAVFDVGGSVVNAPHLIALFVGSLALDHIAQASIMLIRHGRKQRPEPVRRGRVFVTHAGEC